MLRRMRANTLDHGGTGSQSLRSERTALLTVDDLCAVLRLGRTTVYRLLREGEFVPIRVGAHLRFRPEDIDRYLEARREPVNVP